MYDPLSNKEYLTNYFITRVRITCFLARALRFERRLSVLETRHASITLNPYFVVPRGIEPR